MVLILSSFTYVWSKELNTATVEWKGKPAKVVANTLLLQVSNNKAHKALLKEMEKLGYDVIVSPDKLGVMRIEIPESTEIIDAIEIINKIDGINNVEPDVIDTYMLTSPNDTYYGNQWHLPKIQAPKAWDISKGSSSVKIGILDTGIPIQNGSLSHLDLQESGKFLLGYDYVKEDSLPDDNVGHGTHVMGIVSATSNNNVGVTGVNWNSDVYTVKVMGPAGGTAYDFYLGVMEAVDNGADIINYSGAGPESSYKVLAIHYANTHDCLIVTSVGNEWGGSILYPAAYSPFFDNLIAVSATTSEDEIAPYSSAGSRVVVSAPGDDIASTLPNYGVKYSQQYGYNYCYMSGTSMAAPIVTGIASIIKSINNSLTPAQIRTIIENSAVDLGPAGFDNSFGHGRVDLYEAIIYTIENYGGTLGSPGQTVTFHENITLASTASLTIASGTTIKFDSGKRLNVNGTLNANNVTFTSSSGIWNGIKYNSGSTGSLTNCTIKKVMTGIYLNESDRIIDNCTITTDGNRTNYGIYVVDASPTIENCDITGTNFLNTAIPSYGVYYSGDNNSNAIIKNNKIDATYGIYLYDASPDILENDITTHMYGLYCTNGSSPKLVWPEQQIDGANYFHGTYVNIAVLANNSSNPILGSQHCESNYFGNNCFEFSMVDNQLVSAGTNCYVKAEHCWWGSLSPSPSLFSGNVDYQPYLTNMPTFSMSSISPESNAFTRILLSGAAPNKNTSEDLTRYYNERWPLEKKVEFLRYLYMLGEITGVADLCKDIIENNPGTPESFYILDLMYQIARDDGNKKDFSKELLKKYIKSLKYDKNMKLLKSKADLLLAGMEDDTKLIDKVYKKNKKTYLGKYALEQKFSYYIHKDDIDNAREVLNLMDEVYPNEEVTYQAHLRISDIESRNLFKSEQFTSTAAEEITLEEYSLKPAYPNPFNPQMTLEYTLPIQSEVECSIFDISGKMVKKFFFNQPAGTHNVIWNADQFSSGVYLIRFTATSVDGTNLFLDKQKVTLLK